MLSEFRAALRAAQFSHNTWLSLRGAFHPTCNLPEQSHLNPMFSFVLKAILAAQLVIERLQKLPSAILCTLAGPIKMLVK